MRLANFFSVAYQIFTIVVRQIKRTSQFCQMFWSFPFCLCVWHKRLYDIDNWVGKVIFGTGYIQEGEKGSNQRKVILSNPILARSDYSWSKHNHNHTHPDDPLSSKPKTLQILNKSLMSWWCSTFWTGRPACLNISSEKSHQEIQHIVKTFPRPSETRILSVYAKVTTQQKR